MAITATLNPHYKLKLVKLWFPRISLSIEATTNISLLIASWYDLLIDAKASSNYKSGDGSVGNYSSTNVGGTSNISKSVTEVDEWIDAIDIFNL